MGAGNEASVSYCVFWKKVCRFTWPSIRDHWRTIGLGVVAIPFLDILVYYQSGRSKASQAVGATMMTNMFPITLAALALTVGYILVIAPFRLYKNDVGTLRRTIDSLSKELDSLKDKSRPAFSFRYEPHNNSSYYHTGDSQGGKFKLVRIGVFNESRSEPLKGVQVKLSRITGCSMADGRLPTPLHFKGDNKNTGDATPFKTETDINPGDELFVDVAQWMQSGDNVPALHFSSVETGIVGQPGMYEYELTIHVTAKNSADDSRTYKTTLDNERLILIPISSSPSV